MELADKSLRVVHIPEPMLSFGKGQLCEHPKDGLYLYGPSNAAKRSAEISVGVIGTASGITHFDSQIKRMTSFISIPPRGKTDKEHRLHLSNFPGLEETFGLLVEPTRIVKRTIDARTLDEATRRVNHHESVRAAVDLYVQEIDGHEKNEEQRVDIWVLGSLVWQRLRLVRHPRRRPPAGRVFATGCDLPRRRIPEP